jgi:hypothetical protein
MFDVGWAVAVFFGLRTLAARLLAVRIGPVAAIVCGALGVGAGLGLQRAVAGDASGVASYPIFAVLSLMATMAVVALLGLTARPGRAPFRRVGRGAAALAGPAPPRRAEQPLPLDSVARRPLRLGPLTGFSPGPRQPRGRHRLARRAAGGGRHLRQARVCVCTEHGTQLGRRRPRGLYAEAARLRAESQRGRWTKASPAR